MNKDAHLSNLQHRLAAYSDQQAYEELFRLFAPALVQFARSIVHQQQVAEDIVAEVFTRIWEKRHTLDQIHNLKLYLYTAARNFSINHIRAGQRHSTVTLEEMQAEPYIASNTPAELAMSAELLKHIQTSINELPPRCRIIFQLVKEDGLKQKEVAELLHISPKTVENQLAIALQKMAVSIRAFAPDINMARKKV